MSSQSTAQKPANSRRKKALGIGAGAALTVAACAIFLQPVTGADFSASDTGRVDVATATLTIELSDNNDVGTFDLDFTNLKPGETQAQTFTVKNTGSIAADVTLGGPVSAVSGSIGNANPSQLKIGVAGFQALTPAPQLASGAINLGALAAGESRSYTLQVSLDSAAGNEWQGKTVGATATVTLDQQ